MKKLGALILGAILTIGIGAGISVKPATDVVKAEAGDVYKELDLTTSTNTKVSSYTAKWTATHGTEVWNIFGANNNNNGWKYCKFGRKNNASTGYIETSFSVDKPISQVKFITTAANSKYVDKFELVVASDSSFSNVLETVAGNTLTQGENTFTLESMYTNAYYRIVLNSNGSSGSNGSTASVTGVKLIEGSTEEIALTSISVNDVEVIETLTAKATFAYSPANTTQTGVEWSTGDSSIATVNEDGVVTGVSVGETTLRVTSTVNTSIYGEATIVVDEYLQAKIETVSVSELIQKTSSDNTVIRVIGRVNNITKAEYGNLYLEDLEDSSKTILVYGSTTDASTLVKTDTGLGYYTATYTSYYDQFKNACVVGDYIVMEAIFIYYNGTPEISGVIVDYGTDEARAFAKTAYESLEEACTDYNVTEKEWAEVATLYSNLSENVRNELASATLKHKSSTIKNWIDRYERIVTGFGYEGFMTGHVISSSNMLFTTQENSIVIVSIIALIAMLGAVAMLVIRKRKYSK